MRRFALSFNSCHSPISLFTSGARCAPNPTLRETVHSRAMWPGSPQLKQPRLAVRPTVATWMPPTGNAEPALWSVFLVKTVVFIAGGFWTLLFSTLFRVLASRTLCPLLLLLLWLLLVLLLLLLLELLPSLVLLLLRSLRLCRRSLLLLREILLFLRLLLLLRCLLLL